VGRFLADSLVSAGFDVWGVDQHDDPSSPAKKTFAIDLCDRDAVAEMLESSRPDQVVHLAAQSSAGRSFEEPHFTIENNVLPALHILEYLRGQPEHVTRLLAVSSADVYGPVTNKDLPLKESREPNPVSPYALSKWLQEQCCDQYASLYGVDVVMARSFNHTGAGQREAFVLSSFAKQVAEIKEGAREPRVYVGNIDVRRDFLDVRDVCRAYTMLLDKGKPGSVYNICSGQSYSIRELLEKLAVVAGVEIDIEVDPSRVRPVDIEELYGDNTRVAADVGWKPAIPIEETLASLVDYWSKNM